MKQYYYLIIAYITAILGAILLLAGLYAGTYYEVLIGWREPTQTIYPYAQYVPSLLICGIISLIISTLMWRASKAIPIPA
jgi:hypothetical protein